MNPHHAPIHAIDTVAHRRHLDRSAALYNEATPLQAEVCRRLLDRLDLVRLEPASVLDAGCGTGQAAESLARRYRKARVTALEGSTAMLAQASRRQRLFRRFGRVCGDLAALPLGGASQDLVISSLALHWCNDLDRAFGEFARVLRPGGLVQFAMYGPDTLKELRQAWSQVDGYSHVNVFVDMHDLGDALVRAGFEAPVLDVEHLTVNYRNLDALVADLRNSGQTNVTSGRPRGLTTPGRRRALEAAYEGWRSEDGLPATYEIVYGHAWAGEPRQRVNDRGETLVPLDSLGLRRARD